MRYANLNGARITPAPGVTGATCPVCSEPVIPKCGQVNSHHFSHLSTENCDPWHEHMTKWHMDWQNMFPENQREVIIDRGGVRHVADVLTSSGHVIEFQHSPISATEIDQRERFYGSMVWVFDARGKDITFTTNPPHKFASEQIKRYSMQGGDHHSDIVWYHWKHAPKTLFRCRKPVFIHHGGVHVHRIKLHSDCLPRFCNNGYENFFPARRIHNTVFVGFFNNPHK